MDNTSPLPADATAERLVRHFQAEGFAGISEALILRIALRKGDRMDVDAAFRAAAEQDRTPPVGDFFDIRPCGHFSTFRSFDAARAAIKADFSVQLRQELPSLYFEPAPVLIDDALATGSKYDLMLKLRDNVGAYAFATLLNDPESTLFEYLGSHSGMAWDEILGDFGNAAARFAADVELL